MLRAALRQRPPRHPLARAAEPTSSTKRPREGRGRSSTPAARTKSFSPGTTAAINLVARSWGDANVRAGDEILLTEMEHHSNLVPWQQLAERTGARAPHIPLTDDGRLELDALDELLTERTKLVASPPSRTCWARSTRSPKSFAGRTTVGAVVLVDAAQSVPHMATDVHGPGRRFLAFSGHKMLRPVGHRRALRRAGTAGGDAAVPGRRQHDQTA